MALALVFIAGVTDGIDGYLARHFAWTSRLGAYLDPIADKLLLVSLYIVLGMRGVVPLWLMWLVLGRDVVILGMIAFAFVFTSIRSFPPSVWGKISTIIQMGAAVALLGGRAFELGLERTWFQTFAVWTTAAVTIWSGVHYTWLGLKRLRHPNVG